VASDTRFFVLWLKFVVDHSGTIRLAYRYQYCEDFPDPRILTSAIREASRAAS